MTDQTPDMGEIRDEDIRPTYKALLARINAALKAMSERANRPYAYLPTEGAGDRLILSQFAHVADTLEALNALPSDATSLTLTHTSDTGTSVTSYEWNTPGGTPVEGNVPTQDVTINVPKKKGL